jgi:pentatricopeptide repeat protein
MLAYAKNNNLERVLELEEEASVKYKILPSVNRLNSILMAYAR